MSGQGSKGSSRGAEEMRLSYAQWLTTPSEGSSLVLTPEPWFSPEVRDAKDHRVRWVDLSSLDAQISNKEMLSETQPKQDRGGEKGDRQKRVQGHQDEDVARDQSVSHAQGSEVGHYLDHMEVVQQRDEERNAGKNSQRNRRRRSKRSSRNRGKTSSQDRSQTQVNTQGQTQQQNPSQPKTQNKKRRRRGKGKSAKDS